MKKSISAILVAALMLFAFTACEQQMPTYKVPTGLTISTTKTDYIVGEVLDSSTFSGTVRYSDGSSDTLTGSELSFADLTAIADGENTITVNYGGVTGKEATVVSATATVYGYKITDVVLGNLPTTVAQAKEGGDASQTLSSEGVTVTVTYNGKTRDLVAGEYSLTLSADTTTVTKENEDGVNISANLSVLGGTSLADNVKMTTGKIVVTEYVGEKEFDADDIDSLAVGFVDEEGEFTTTGVVYYGDATTVFAVQATDGQGLKKVLSGSGKEAYTIEVSSGDLSTTSRTNVVAILSSDKTIKSPAFSVTPANYVVSIAVSQNENTTIDEHTSTADSALASKITVTATMKAALDSAGTMTKKLAANEYTFDVAYLVKNGSQNVIYTGSQENPSVKVQPAAFTVSTWTPEA